MVDRKSLHQQALSMAWLKGGTAEVEAETKAIPDPTLDLCLQRGGKVKVTLHQVGQNLAVIHEVAAIPLHVNKIMALTKALKAMCMGRVLTTNIADTREDLGAEAPLLPTADHVKVQKLGNTKRKATTTASAGGNVPDPMRG